MLQETVISVEKVSKTYCVWDKPMAQLVYIILSALFALLPRKSSFRKRFESKAQKRYKEFHALSDISFEIRKGESVGIIGLNGSGKSTLLQIIAGTLQPSKGKVKVQGRIAALLELGSGFNPEFTGRENVFLNASILGVKKSEVLEKFPAIESFADIGDYIDQPVKTYSSGMLVRLAFSVQVQLRPDILIIDEALAVGDTLFQKRCFQHLDELIRSGVTLLFVSHNEEVVRTLTQQAILLKHGSIKAIGDSPDIVREYQRQIHGEEEAYIKHLNNETTQKKNEAELSNSTSIEKLSFGDKEIEILSVQILNGTDSAQALFHPGEVFKIRIRCRANEDQENINIGIRVRNREGIKIYSWGTLNQDMQIMSGARSGEVFWEQTFSQGQDFCVEFTGTCRLGRNFYEVQAIASKEETPYYGNQRVLHWIDEAGFFSVELSDREYFFGGVSDMEMEAAHR